MDFKELKRKYRIELFTGAMVLGLVQVLVLFLQYLMRDNASGILYSILSWGNLIAIITVFVVYGRKLAAIYGPTPMGLTYGKAFGFFILMSLLSGVIYGAGYYLISEVVDPGYFAAVQQEALELLVNSGNWSDAQIDAMKSAMGLTHNLFVVIFSYVMVMLFQGGFVALFISAIVKRPPMPQPPPAV